MSVGRDPVIDSAGFEIYTLVCKLCGYRRSGVLDPYDQRLC
jgi:hypothetical protein